MTGLLTLKPLYDYNLNKQTINYVNIIFIRFNPKASDQTIQNSRHPLKKKKSLGPLVDNNINDTNRRRECSDRTLIVDWKHKSRRSSKSNLLPGACQSEKKEQCRHYCENHLINLQSAKGKSGMGENTFRILDLCFYSWWALE